MISRRDAPGGAKAVAPLARKRKLTELWPPRPGTENDSPATPQLPRRRRSRTSCSTRTRNVASWRAEISIGRPLKACLSSARAVASIAARSCGVTAPPITFEWNVTGSNQKPAATGCDRPHPPAQRATAASV